MVVKPEVRVYNSSGSELLIRATNRGFGETICRVATAASRPTNDRAANAGGAFESRRGSSPELPSPPSRGNSAGRGPWASREANAAGTRLPIADLLEAVPRRISALFDQTLDVIEDALQARRIFAVQGVVVDGGPVHYARIAAAKLFIQLTSSRK